MTTSHPESKASEPSQSSRSDQHGEPGPVGVLRREIWPRTIRTAIASALFPWVRSRSHQRRIDVEIAGYQLPAGVAALASRTVRATRLWPEERRDVARELCTHFSDGVSAGRTEAQLIADFGDASRAAGLIRRAKVRCRPMWWKSFRWLTQGTAALAVVLLLSYGYLAGRYFWGTPTLRFNYAAEFNAVTLATPVAQRAWPEYVQAVREIGPLPEWYQKTGDWPTTADDANWAEGVEFLRARQPALGRIRNAAKRPALGYVYSNITDPDYMRAMEVRNPTFKFDPTQEKAVENPALFGILLPYLGEMRSMARLLRHDAQVAAAIGDRERYMLDLEAVLDLSEQCLDGRFVIDTLVGIAIGDLAAAMAFELLHADESAELPLLTSEDVTRLAHRFAALGGGSVRLDVEMEGRYWNDMLQRVFSDNGAGDGHLIQSAADDIYRDFGAVNPTNNKFVKAVMPVMAAIKPSRAEFAAQIKVVVATMRADAALPPWRADERTTDVEYAKLHENCFGPMDIAKALGGESPYQAIFASRDLFEAKRAAVQTVCALTVFKRTTGQYPRELATLVPKYLPSVPIDPFDGKPLRYRVTGDGSSATVLLYSVGSDGADHGGVEPANPADVGKAGNLRLLGAFRNPSKATPVQVKEMAHARGDWVVFPQPRPLRKDGTGK